MVSGSLMLPQNWKQMLGVPQGNDHFHSPRPSKSLPLLFLDHHARGQHVSWNLLIDRTNPHPTTLLAHPSQATQNTSTRFYGPPLRGGWHQKHSYVHMALATATHPVVCCLLSNSPRRMLQILGDVCRICRMKWRGPLYFWTNSGYHHFPLWRVSATNSMIEWKPKKPSPEDCSKCSRLPPLPKASKRERPSHENVNTFLGDVGPWENQLFWYVWWWFISKCTSSSQGY